MVKNDEIEPVLEQLRLLHMCSRCLLRFAGIRTYSSYVSKDVVEKNIEDLLPSLCTKSSLNQQSEDCSPPKRHHVPPCCSCLGVLQDECDNIVSKIETAVRESGFQFTDFVMQLSLPVAIDLRQSLLHIYLKKKFGKSYDRDLSDIPTVKEVWKWVVGGQLGTIMKAEFSPHSDFQIAISVIYEDLVKECKALLASCPAAFPNRKKKKAKLENIYNRTSVMKAIEQLSSELSKMFELPPMPPDNSCVYEDIVCTHSPLYLGGRYNKYSRELSQTPWVVDGERRMESSVQELITDTVIKYIKADNIVFSASGREDVDVRMLGNGRPFVLEVINPRKVFWTSEEMKKIESDVNTSTDLIAVRDLQVISKKDTQLLKDGEEQKRKTYAASCVLNREVQPDDLQLLGGLKDITVKQKTPIRVLHRRTLATREKIIHKIDGKVLGSHQLDLVIETQAGTYVKEFVHSDFGRTIPSLGTLLQSEVDILTLDVESVHLDWPPPNTIN